MAETAKNSHISEEEYLEIERSSKEKHEYYNGKIFAMAGATYEHTIIVPNISRGIGIQLKGKACTVHTNDLKVRMEKVGSYAYPDIAVICGKPEFLDDKRDVVTNPVLVIEVLSDSTEKYDRGEKLKQYRSLDSLREYVLVSQTAKRIENFYKNDAGLWIFDYVDEDHPELILKSIECKLGLDDIYDKVFETPYNE